MIMTFFFGVTAPELREGYDISFVPTAILFVNGQEKRRWMLNTTRRSTRRF